MDYQGQALESADHRAAMERLRQKYAAAGVGRERKPNV